MIVGKFLLFDADAYALIDPKSTHFYNYTTTPSEKGLHAELLSYDILWTIILWESNPSHKD